MDLSLFINRRVGFASVIAVMLIAVAGLLLAQRGVVDAPSQTDEVSAPNQGYPAHIHQGSCETPDPEQTQSLTGAMPQGGTEASGWAFASETTIETPLANLFAQPHAIAVMAEKSENDQSIVVACGEIAGQVAEGKSVLGLTSNRTGDLAGVVVLTDQRGQQTVVELYLILANDGTTVGQDGDIDESEDAADDSDDAGEDNDSGGDGV